jgi:hypothetical protein
MRSGLHTISAYPSRLLTQEFLLLSDFGINQLSLSLVITEESEAVNSFLAITADLAQIVPVLSTKVSERLATKTNLFHSLRILFDGLGHRP